MSRLLQQSYLIFVTLHCVVISDDTVQYALQEQVTIGTRVGNVIVSSGIRKLYQKHEIQQLEFRFLSEPPIPLSIGTSDGVIRTSGVIDRDVMPWCRQSDVCEVNLDVTVQPVDYFRIIKVTISVVDINDNPPRFSETQSVLAILESASVGSTFLLPSATDADSPAFGVHRYELISYTSKFGVKVTSKLDGFLDVRLQLIERLDREAQDEYRMTLIAFDGGDPAKSDSLNVTARILDSNDNDPVFDRQNYDVSVVENTSRNVTIGTVRATDADVGANGQVVYGFTLQTHALYGHVFAIDNVTGAITLKQDLDREQVGAYQLIVTAEDQGPDSHPVDVTVLVSVEDTNDNRPEITVNTLAAVGSDWASVPENSPVGTFVAHVTVFDPDAGSNGTVSCSLENDYFSLVKRSLVQQSETEYQILTARPLDREIVPQFNVSLDCIDYGSPQQRSIKSLLVNVLDENDNSPYFSQDVYRVSVFENNQKGQPVVQLNATDDDDGDNGRIHFVVVGQQSLAFAVSARGLVTAKHVIDREDTAFYRFYVQAVDGGSAPARTGSALVVISVKDLNDESPVFTQSSYSFSIRENEEPGVFVGETSATDIDLEPFNTVEYAFLQENQATDSFFIDPVNGTITTRCSLDREDQPIYHLAVAAIDRAATPPLTSSASLVIYVDDDNDNAPVFEFPSLTNNTLHVSSRAPVGLVLTTLQAKDRDEDLNSKISFRLQSGNDDGMFHLDHILGSVFVNRVLFDIHYHVYRLLVVAEDHGYPPQFTSAHLNIVVNRSIPFSSSSSSTDVLPHPVVIVVVVVGSGCLLLVVALVLWLMIIRPRNSHSSLQHPLEKAVSCRPEGLRMLQATRDNGGGGGGGGAGGSSAEGTPIKRPLVLHSAATATNNNLDHLNQQERKSLSSADGFYGDGYQGNSNDDDATSHHHCTSFRNSLPVTSSNVWPLTSSSRAPNPGYSTYDKHFTPSSRLHTRTLPQPPRLREPEPVWAPLSPQPDELHLTGNGATVVARQRLQSGYRSNCIRRAEPVYTNSAAAAALQSQQHTLLI